MTITFHTSIFFWAWLMSVQKFWRMKNQKNKYAFFKFSDFDFKAELLRSTCFTAHSSLQTLIRMKFYFRLYTICLSFKKEFSSGQKICLYGNDHKILSQFMWSVYTSFYSSRKILLTNSNCFIRQLKILMESYYITWTVSFARVALVCIFLK